jgi:hypothetical protein
MRWIVLLVLIVGAVVRPGGETALGEPLGEETAARLQTQLGHQERVSRNLWPMFRTWFRRSARN